MQHFSSILLNVSLNFREWRIVVWKMRHFLFFVFELTSSTFRDLNYPPFTECKYDAFKIRFIPVRILKERSQLCCSLAELFFRARRLSVPRTEYSSALRMVRMMLIKRMVVILCFLRYLMYLF